MGKNHESHFTKKQHNQKNYSDNTPFPVRFGELKDKMQQDAFISSTSISEVAKGIIKKHYDFKEMSHKEKVIELVNKLFSYLENIK